MHEVPITQTIVHRNVTALAGMLVMEMHIGEERTDPVHEIRDRAIPNTDLSAVACVVLHTSTVSIYLKPVRGGRSHPAGAGPYCTAAPPGRVS